MPARVVYAAVAAASCLLLGAGAASAQKAGGTLRVYHRDNPPSASPLEEATNSVTIPYMSIYNNLIMFDNAKPHESAETIVPDLAESWAWDDTKTKLTFKLRQGVKWHDGKPFTSKDVQCTWHMLIGKARDDDFRRNPRAIWYQNLSEVTLNGDYEATFVLKQPQPAFPLLLASGYSPVYPCHVSQRDMRTKPVGTGPFKFVEYRRGESITLVKNADYWKKGRPYLDGIEFKIIEDRSTRVLAFVAGNFDLTFPTDITVPLAREVKAQAPKAVCQLYPTGVSDNLIINREKPPFDKAEIRKAMSLALDRGVFNKILFEGQAKVGGAMLPAPSGEWGMPDVVLHELTGYGDVEVNLAEARRLMQSQGYGPDKPLKVRVSTRNTAIYRDPAVILIDQLKKIYIDGELEPVDTPQWFPKVARKDYSVGMNLTGVSVDDPDGNLVENYSCKSERNYTQYCNPEVDRLLNEQSKQTDKDKRKRIVWQIEKLLVDDAARPIIDHNVAGTCWQPYVHGFVPHDNSIYNNTRYEDVWLDK
jgi:peptide/nickel transport system substrate-binding protein